LPVPNAQWKEVLVTRSLWIVVAVLFVLWAIGFFVARLGVFVHLLLAATLIVTFYNVLKAGDRQLP
jgi:hypothetical protein